MPGLDGIRDFSVHGDRRRPWNKAMSSAALKGYEEILVNKVTELVAGLNKREGAVINLSAWMSFFGRVLFYVRPTRIRVALTRRATSANSGPCNPRTVAVRGIRCAVAMSPKE